MMPGYEISGEPRGSRDRVTLIVVHELHGSERELFAATAVGDGGVRFWFGYCSSALEQPWRRLVLDSVRLARVEGQTQDLAQVLGEQLKAHPAFGSAFEVEVEQFFMWQEAEARAVILGARQEEVRHPWDWSHLEQESSGSR
jgi:hypothetical protein